MSNADTILEQLAARRAKRDAEYQRHANMLLDAKLIDLSAIGRAARPAAIVRATPGETVTASSMGDFLDKYARVTPGTTIDLGTTVLDFGNTAQFGLRPNVTILNGEIRATRPKGTARVPEKNCFAMIAPAGTPGICFRKTRFRFNNGGVFFESGVIGATFDGVDVVHGTDHSYYSGLAYFAGGGLPGAVFINGFYHDSQASDRTMELWGWSRGDYSFNRFDNVKDGGHIMENGGGNRMTYNLFTRLGRMGVEVQGNAVADGFLYEGNVAYTWVNPYFDCELISMCAVNQTGVVIRRNFARNDFVGPWGNVEDQGQRFGIAIEAMTADNGCVVEENVIGGPNRWACIVAAGSKNMLCRNQRVYGASTVWGDYVNEPGTRGTGTFINGGDNERLSNPMPDPPTIDFGGGGGGNNNQGDTPVFTLTGQTAKQTNPNGGGQILLTWSDPPKGTTKVRIHCRATGDPTKIDTPEVAPTPMDSPVVSDFPVQLDNVHPGWGVDVMAEALNDGNTVLGSTSWQKMQTTAGLSNTKWPPTTIDKPSNDVHVTIEYDLLGGVAKNVKIAHKAIVATILLLATCLFAGTASAEQVVTAAAPKITAEQLQAKVEARGEIVLPYGAVITTKTPIRLHNTTELRGLGTTISYVGDPTKHAIEYADATPTDVHLRGLMIKSVGGGVGLGGANGGEQLSFTDCKFDCDGVGIDFVTANPEWPIYQGTIERCQFINPRETCIKLNGRMCRIIQPKFLFGAGKGAGKPLVHLVGRWSMGTLECDWDEPWYPTPVLKIDGQGGGAQWDLHNNWHEQKQSGVRVELVDATVHADVVGSSPLNPWKLRNATVFADQVLASGDGVTINPATGVPFEAGKPLPDADRWRAFDADSASKMTASGASIAIQQAQRE